MCLTTAPLCMGWQSRHHVNHEQGLVKRSWGLCGACEDVTSAVGVLDDHDASRRLVVSRPV